MKSLVTACLAACVFVSYGAAEDKKEAVKLDAAKLVGVWELTRSTDEGAPKGAIVEFMKDGKLSITIDFNGKEFKLSGKYEMKEDKLTVTITPPDGGKDSSDTDTVKTLTDDKLLLVDKDGKETEFAKKKK